MNDQIISIIQAEDVVIVQNQSFKTYYRNRDGSLGCTVSNAFDYEDATLYTKEDLVAQGTGYTEPVLTVIEGAK
jgi:predicted cupin superfamily sugar epimerase